MKISPAALACLLLTAVGTPVHAADDATGCTPPEGTQRLEFSSDNNRLRGFVDLPATTGPHPIVLIIHGSGGTDVFHGDAPYNGDYTLLRKTFREAGFATAVWDKAGSGCSTGTYSSGNPIRERARETLAALRALKARSDIDPARMGLWGISQGGWIGPMVAVQTDDVAFLILVSAPARDAISQLEYQALTDLRLKEAPAAEVATAGRHLRRALAIMRAGGGVEEYAAAVAPLKAYPTFLELGITRDGSPEQFRAWQNDLDFQYRPDTALSELHQPMLVLFGDRDVLVNWEESKRIFAETLRKSGNRAYQIKVFRGADHGMQRAAGSQPADDYLQTMRAWLIRWNADAKRRVPAHPP